MEPKSVKLKDKSNENIQVFVRVRPLNTNEVAHKSQVVVDATSSKEIVVNERPADRITKKFSYDRVFDRDSKQIEVYRAVVAPLIEEVLSGYNCTVFAYGQTGTGKTYTMEGDRSDNPNVSWDNDPSSGIIPRTLSHLFDELRILQAEYTVRVSFLELYNEELFDLLSATDDTSKLKLYEDVNKKGSVIVHGLEEVPVHNKNEVYKIMEKGSLKRQTAATLMNAKSSRSHTIFSITVHIKENSLEGEELLKTGKLNLVDLAGSENVGRSGAIDKRAREAGNINQSLLTLGRVIMSLVEHTPHVPYRESKLTRLLQDSLGGKTKTSIIATISPAGCSLEETLSTLDYAHRAKNITNRPEINQKLTKKFLLKEYTEEIDRLRRDLMATREGNGVCIAKENYQQMIDELEGLQIEMGEKIGNIRALTDEVAKKEALLEELGMNLEQSNKELKLTSKLLDKSRQRLHTTRVQLRETTQERDERAHLVDKHVETEATLGGQVHELLAVTEESVSDTFMLHDKLLRKLTVEDNNCRVSNAFLHDFNEKIEKLVDDVEALTHMQLEGYKNLQAAIDNHLKSDLETIAEEENIASQLQNSVSHYERDLLMQDREQEKSINDWQDTFLTERRSYAASTCKTADKNLDKLKMQLHSTDNDNNVMQAIIREEKLSLPLKLANHQEAVKKHFALLLEGFAALKNTAVQMVKNQTQAIESAKSESSQLEKSHEKLLSSVQSWFNETRQRHSVINSDLAVAESGGKEMVAALSERIGQMGESTKTFDSLNDKSSNKVNKDFEAFTTKTSVYLIESQKKNEALRLDLEDVHRACREDADAELKRVEGLVQNRTDEIAGKIQKQKHTIEESFQTVQTSSDTHKKILVAQRCKLLNFDTEHRNATGCQADTLSEWSKCTLDDLQARELDVAKYVTKDLAKDVPTGSTPVRKEFQYSKEFAVTSPHQRILERFRATRPSNLHNTFLGSKTFDSSSDCDQTMSIEQELENLTRATNSGLRRSVSTSDIHSLAAESVLNVSTISEGECQQENKENSDLNLRVPLTNKVPNGKLGSLNNVSISRVDSGLKKPLTAQNRSKAKK